MVSTAQSLLMDAPKSFEMPAGDALTSQVAGGDPPILTGRSIALPSESAKRCAQPKRMRGAILFLALTALFVIAPSVQSFGLSVSDADPDVASAGAGNADLKAALEVEKLLARP